MTATELRNKIEEYEKYKIVFMNFSVDEQCRVWGLPEGDKTQHLLNIERLNEYNEFLDKAIKHYENMSKFFKNDPDYTKKLKKYKTYLKRLLNTLKKLKEKNI